MAGNGELRQATKILARDGDIDNRNATGESTEQQDRDDHSHVQRMPVRVVAREEYSYELYAMLFSCLGDLNGDGEVGIIDFLDLLGAWGPCYAFSSFCPADLDGDGIVGVNDLLDLLAAWGPCP